MFEGTVKIMSKKKPKRVYKISNQRKVIKKLQAGKVQNMYLNPRQKETK